jgi:hypothetical protein
VGAHFKLLVVDVHFQARYSPLGPKKVMSDGWAALICRRSGDLPFLDVRVDLSAG